MIHASKYLRPDETAGRDAELELEALMDMMQPGWRERLVFKQYLPSLTVANAAATPGGVVTTPPSAVLSPATASLSDGDDIRAHAIAAAQFAQLQQSVLLPALTPATAALADGDDVRALGIVAVQFDQFQQPASLFALSPATAALRDGDDIRARQLAALEH